MGPAALLKALGGRYFSLTVFGFTQVAIDLESLIYMAQGQWPVHRFLHSALGATIIGVTGPFIGRPICQHLLGLWNGWLSPKQHHWFHITTKISLVAAVTGAFIGAYSHVLLDSIMHSDIQPFAPVSDQNGFLYVVSVGHLHVLCLISGALGLVALVVIHLRNTSSIEIEG